MTRLEVVFWQRVIAGTVQNAFFIAFLLVFRPFWDENVPLVAVFWAVLGLRIVWTIAGLIGFFSLKNQARKGKNRG